MTRSRALPDAVRQKLALLQEATSRMPALEEELRFLEMRLENGDMTASHLGLRSTAEALLLHAVRVEGVKVNGRGTLSDLKQALEPTRKVHSAFWDHLDPVQKFGNRHAHSQSSDVYHQPALRPAHDPWTEVEVCLAHLALMAKEFVQHWPPPSGATLPSLPSEGDDDDDDVPPQSSARTPPNVTGDQVVAYVGEMTAKQALEDEEARLALELITGLQRRGVTRRLNAAHGRTKVRNIFPERYAGAATTAGAAEVEPEEEVGFDYEAIGNLTISQARDLGMAESIARLTNATELSVKRALGKLNGNGVVRRQFSWYEAGTIGELTVRTALDYRMAPLLARHLRRRASTITEALRGAPGQTKLRTVFPALDD